MHGIALMVSSQHTFWGLLGVVSLWGLLVWFFVFVVLCSWSHLNAHCGGGSFCVHYYACMCLRAGAVREGRGRRACVMHLFMQAAQPAPAIQPALPPCLPVTHPRELKPILPPCPYLTHHPPIHPSHPPTNHGQKHVILLCYHNNIIKKLFSYYVQ